MKKTGFDWCKPVLEKVSDAALLLDKDVKIIFANSSFLKLTGYDGKKIVGQSVEVVCASDKECKALREDLEGAANGAASTGKIKITRKDGTVISSEITCIAMKDEKERPAGFTMILRASGEKKESTKDLVAKVRGLEEMNGALTKLIEKGEEEKSEMGDKIQSNVKELVLPYLEKLKSTGLTTEQRTYIDITETTVKNVFSAFLQKVTSKQYRFTPKEIQVATLIREGKTTKQIADIMKVTRSAIGLHRHHIRNKLGLGKAKVNLRSHLLSLQ